MSDKTGKDRESSDPLAAFGGYLRSQRKLAELSLRQLADLTSLSNPYLSKLERGLHQPSVAAITNIAKALGLPVEAVLAKAAGLVPGLDGGSSKDVPSTEAAIKADPALNDEQKRALLGVYRSFVDSDS